MRVRTRILLMVAGIASLAAAAMVIEAAATFVARPSLIRTGGFTTTQVACEEMGLAPEEFYRSRVLPSDSATDTVARSGRSGRWLLLETTPRAVNLIATLQVDARTPCGQLFGSSPVAAVDGELAWLLGSIEINRHPVRGWEYRSSEMADSVRQVVYAATVPIRDYANIRISDRDVEDRSRIPLTDSVLLRTADMQLRHSYPPPDLTTDSGVVYRKDLAAGNQTLVLHASVSVSDAAETAPEENTRSLLSLLANAGAPGLWLLGAGLAAIMPLLLFVTAPALAPAEAETRDARQTTVILIAGAALLTLAAAAAESMYAESIRATAAKVDTWLGTRAFLPSRPFITSGAPLTVLGIAALVGSAWRTARRREPPTPWYRRLALIAVPVIAALSLVLGTFQDVAGWMLVLALGILAAYAATELTAASAFFAGAGGTVTATLAVVAGAFLDQMPFDAWYAPVLWFVVAWVMALFLLQALTRLVVPAGTSSHQLASRGLWLVAGVCVLPLGPLLTPGTEAAAWFHATLLGSTVRQILLPAVPLAWVLVVLRLLRQTGDDMAGRPAAWAAGSAAAAAVLFPQHADFLLLPLTLILGWIGIRMTLTPTEPRADLRDIHGAVIQRRTDLVRASLELKIAETATRTARQQQLTELSAGRIDYAAYLKGEQDRRTALAEMRAGGAGGPLRALAFNFAPHDNGWANGIHGAKWSLVIGSPWVLLAFIESLDTGFGSVYPMWSVLLIVLTTTLRWAAIGFLMGFYFPLIRGSSGLTKGLTLFAGLALPLFPVPLLTLPMEADLWQPIVFLAFQLLAQCLLLGLLAFDLQLLRIAGERSWRSLFDLHGIPALGASLSSILIAIGGAVATLVVNQSTGFIGKILTFLAPRGLTATP